MNSSHSSAINAALIVPGVQNEAKDIHTPWQDSLLRKMFNIDVQGLVCLPGVS